MGDDTRSTPFYAHCARAGPPLRGGKIVGRPPPPGDSGCVTSDMEPRPHHSGRGEVSSAGLPRHASAREP
eukprot:1689542-Prymnesium_polylepis.1